MNRPASVSPSSVRYDRPAFERPAGPAIESPGSARHDTPASESPSLFNRFAMERPAIDLRQHSQGPHGINGGNKISPTNNVGIYVRLTNTYCLVADFLSNTKFFTVLMGELGETIPVVSCSVAQTGALGAMTVGNKNGLLVPHTTTDMEMMHLRVYLPDSIRIERLGERMTALGNICACNDYVSLINPEVDRETEKLVADVLGVEVFRASIGKEQLPGTYFVMTNQGGMACTGTE